MKERKMRIAVYNELYAIACNDNSEDKKTNHSNSKNLLKNMYNFSV
jgi:hypothetical protein